MPQQQVLLDLQQKTASTSLGIRRGKAPAGRPPLLGAGAGGATAGFVANSGLVLQFDAYFKEAVDESPLENHRVRKCKILVYLEDSSVQIDEYRQENSGMPQGTLVKRHQIPYPEVTSRYERLALWCLPTVPWVVDHWYSSQVDFKQAKHSVDPTRLTETHIIVRMPGSHTVQSLVVQECFHLSAENEISRISALRRRAQRRETWILP